MLRLRPTVVVVARTVGNAGDAELAQRCERPFVLSLAAHPRAVRANHAGRRREHGLVG
jgi:hypothetical protein